MITPQELRLGNYFKVPTMPYLGLQKVQAITGKYISGIDFNLVEPIELTEELLFKMGFMCNKNEYCILGFDRFNIFQSVKGPYLFCDDEKASKDIKYVHQLQNLFFALTGEELTIKENYGVKNN